MAPIYVRSGKIQPTNLKCNNTEQVYQITNEKRALRETRPGTRSDSRSRITSRNVKPLFLLLRTNTLTLHMILCVLLYGGAYASGHIEQRFAIEPQDQVAVVGSRVTLPCRVENKAGQLQWTKDDFGLGTHRHLVGYDRYHMIGSDEEGDYSLDIREVTLDDDAQYQCQVSSGPGGEPAIRSRYARLSVLVAPDPPKILQGSFIEVIEDSEQVFECVSVGGKPPAEITWVDGEGGVLNQNVVYTAQPMSDGRRFTARSILRLRPRRYHDKQNLICQAQNTADRAYKSAAIKLKVKYAPTVRLFLKSNIASGRIFEGDKLRLGCEAEGNPSNFTYKWYLNNQEIPGNFTNELVITNLTRKYNDNTMKCEVHNTVGKSADSRILEVSYGPRFITKPQNVEGEIGATVVLKCTVDGHPMPETIWVHYENGGIVKVGHSSELRISVNVRTAGEYWCRATVDGFPPIEAPATVFVKGPPKIISNSTQYGVEGGRISVDCLTFSVPRPIHFLWTFEGQELKPHDQDYEFLEEALSEGLTKSTLMIREGRSNHFGTYNCTVHNSYGSDTFEIYLEPHKTLPYLLTVSIAAACVIGVVSITAIVVLCQRRRRKMPDDDVKKPDVTDIGKGDCSDKCNSDQSSNISELKLELRQVEGGCDAEFPNQSASEYRIAAGLELPLAGLVPLPNATLDEKYMKHSRYSTDFSDPTNNLHFKVSNQVNGYVQYVDYEKDYLPPALNSDFSGPLTRSKDSNNSYSEIQNVHNLKPSNSNQAISTLGVQAIGPDVIPFTSGDLRGGVDLSYVATYGNPYLKNNDPKQVYTNPIKAERISGPPPYYSLRNSTLPPAVATAIPLGACLSRVRGSIVNSNNTGGQPQALRSSPQSSSALYILPPPNRSGQCNQLSKCNGDQTTNGTHV